MLLKILLKIIIVFLKILLLKYINIIMSYIERELIIENKKVENWKNLKKKLIKEIFKLNNEVQIIEKKVEELNDKNNFDLSYKFER